HVQDVAQAFLTALRESSTIGKTYVLGGPEVLSWTEMLRRIARTVGRKKWILPMPIGIIEKWRRRYNERRPHSSQNYITPEMAYFGVREKRKT
ncbi:MAG: integrase core domain-containing protein, partial [Proteobacteria bacterium]|nr:integrase core domain-containing protein [Pseudomonadota bacterium]